VVKREAQEDWGWWCIREQIDIDDWESPLNRALGKRLNSP
jgi:hypothetical protein